MQNHYDLIIQNLASRTPPPRVVAIVRAPDGALLRVTGTIYPDRIERSSR